MDEIYGSLNTLNTTDLDSLIHFADNNLKTIKLLPDSKNRMLRNLAVEYYGYVPIISLRTIPLDKVINKRRHVHKISEASLRIIHIFCH